MSLLKFCMWWADTRLKFSKLDFPPWLYTGVFSHLNSSMLYKKIIIIIKISWIFGRTANLCFYNENLELDKIFVTLNTLLMF